MDIRIEPSPISGEVAAIPSKSDAHRIFICASLANEKTAVSLPSSSKDIEATLMALEAMGAIIERSENEVTVTPAPFKSKVTVNASESGSTLRFLVPVASAVCDEVTFEGSGRLPERPIGHLLDALSKNGVSFSSKKLPFTKTGALRAGVYTLPGNVSSQYVTGLLFALPLLSGDSRIVLTSRLESAAYIDITLAALKKFGIEIENTDGSFLVKGNQKYVSPSTLTIDGDWSNAAFFLVSGAIRGSVSLTGLDLNSPQGDKKIVDVLHTFGANVLFGESVTVKQSPLYSAKIDISEIPDMLPSLAILASFAKGKTEFVGGARLRIKESDRLKSATKMINSLGGKATELDEGLIIEGVGLKGGEVDGENDHRIVMAAAIGGSLSEKGVIIRGAEAVKKSYPSFFKDFSKAGGKYSVI